MPRTGSVFTLTPSTVAPAVAGTPASAPDFNAAMDDISQALSDSMVTDAPAFTSPASFDGGTEDAPGITFTGDLDTGIWHPAANQVGITVDGAVTGTVLLAKTTGVDVTGDLDTSGNATIGGDTTISGDLNVTGTISGASAAPEISADSGAFTTSSAVAVDVDNLTVTITTTAAGRPILLTLQPAATGTGGVLPYMTGNPAIGDVTGFIAIVREVGGVPTTVAIYASPLVKPGEEKPIQVPAFVDTPAAGTYTYKVRAYIDVGGVLSVTECYLLAYEL